MKDKAESNLINEEFDFLLDTSYGEETMEELTIAVMLMAQIQPIDGNAETVPLYDAKAISEVNASLKVHDQMRHEKRKTIIQISDDDQIDSNIIFDDPYVENNGESRTSQEAIAVQPKMYDGEKLNSSKLVIDSPNSEETLEDAENIRSKMRNKMVQINYAKLNVIYETFVPQKDFSVEQTYFSLPSTSFNGSESKAVTSNLPIPKMPNESKLFYKTDVIPMYVSLSKSLKELKEEFIEEIDRLLEVSLTSEIQNCVLMSVEKQKNQMLNAELERSSNDSKDIQANLLKRTKVLENDFKRSQAQIIYFELKLQYQKEKMACEVSWKSKLSTMNDENVFLKTQVDSVVKEREKMKLEY
ncbi:hypothetical protein Tco_0425622 [Tanacetum coccineum]